LATVLIHIHRNNYLYKHGYTMDFRSRIYVPRV